MKHITHDVETKLSCCVHAINEAPLHLKERKKLMRRELMRRKKEEEAEERLD